MRNTGVAAVITSGSAFILAFADIGMPLLLTAAATCVIAATVLFIYGGKAVLDKHFFDTVHATMSDVIIDLQQQPRVQRTVNTVTIEGRRVNDHRGDRYLLTFADPGRRCVVEADLRDIEGEINGTLAVSTRFQESVVHGSGDNWASVRL